MYKWLGNNKEWVFSGIGITILGAVAFVAKFLWDYFIQDFIQDVEHKRVILVILLATFVALVGVFLLFYYLRFQLHLQRESIESVKKSLEGPKIFNDWDQVQPEIKNSIRYSLENNDATDIQCLGVALHVSWKMVRECIEQYQRDHGKFPKITIQLRVLSPKSEFWKILGDSWQRRNETLFKSIAEFKKTISGNKEVVLHISTYTYFPNWHGVLINEQHLFRSSCLYRDNEFTVHKNPYVYFRYEDNFYSDMQIKEFKYWISMSVDLPPSKDNDLPPSKDNDLPPSKDNDLPPSKDNDPSSSKDNDLPPSRDNDPPPSKRQ